MTVTGSWQEKLWITRQLNMMMVLHDFYDLSEWITCPPWKITCECAKRRMDRRKERKKKLTASLLQSTKIFSGFICCLNSQHFCYFSSNQTYYTQFLQERQLLVPHVILQLKNKWFLLLFYKFFTSNIWTRWLLISEKKISITFLSELWSCIRLELKRMPSHQINQFAWSNNMSLLIYLKF